MYKLQLQNDVVFMCTEEMAAAFVILNEAERGRRQVPRVIRDRQHQLDHLTDQEILLLYRLSKQMIFDLCDVLQDE